MVRKTPAPAGRWYSGQSQGRNMCRLGFAPTTPCQVQRWVWPRLRPAGATPASPLDGASLAHAPQARACMLAGRLHAWEGRQGRLHAPVPDASTTTARPGLNPLRWRSMATTRPSTKTYLSHRGGLAPLTGSPMPAKGTPALAPHKPALSYTPTPLHARLRNDMSRAHKMARVTGDVSMGPTYRSTLVMLALRI